MMVDAVRAENGVHPAQRELSSFRDPAGYLFWHDGEIFRCVNAGYRRQLEQAESSGLLKSAVDRGLLLPFERVDTPACEDAVAILKPVQLGFVTYPYEWSFSELKDAALATLDLHMLALDHGMLLKDASAYNIQFVLCRPVLIDHLSFDLIENHTAWPAYGQFCRHFLAPLALMSEVDLTLGRLSQLHIDGIPLELAAKLLPKRTRFRPGLYMHLHLHARMSVRHAGTRESVKTKRLSIPQLKAFASSLRSLVASLAPKNQETEWGNYYCETNYSHAGQAFKLACVRDFVARVRPHSLWDMGGNDGRFARSLSPLVSEIVCLDIDPVAVDINYQACKREGVRNVMPMLLDCCNPAPSIGFANRERRALLERGKPDLVTALALIHHLAIANNVPLGDVAAMFADLSPNLVIEFVDKPDSQVQRLLANRTDIFDAYTEDGFRAAFCAFFDIVEEHCVPDAHRTLYLMRRKAPHLVHEY